jgi:hypothetical protein
MADELKELPRSWLERKLGDLGVGMSTVGRSMAEGVAPLAEKYPVRHWLSENLLTSPLQSAGAALQDYTATPRDITPEYPYRARLFDPRQPAMIDPRALDLTQFAAPVAGRVRNAARFALPDLKAAAIAAYGPDVSAAHVVKPKGGNWVPGDVEGSITRLKSASIPDYRQHPLPPGVELPLNAEAQTDALRNWVDTKLNRYIKNELATPEDPVRALAERGISHLQEGRENFSDPSSSVMRRRREAGQNPMGAGVSPLAKQWERLADEVVGNQTARDLSSLERESVFGNKLVPPETPVHYMSISPLFNLELVHLVDELRNAVNPAAGLPRNLQLTPEQLSKVTVPQAVERVAKINAWREAQIAEATAAGANNAAVTLHREYPTIPGTDAPNERGLRWVELKTPKQDVMENRDIAINSLEDALKYEGDTMGHCVGGYCPDVVSGKSRIYSLRDAKGQPHVTIEVQPKGLKYERVDPGMGDRDLMAAMGENMTPRQSRQFQNWLENDWDGGDLSQDVIGTAWEKFLPPKVESPRIVQIKGKGNRKPNDEYLPFVQDFVRSGQWSEVGDIQNADMFKLPDNRFVTRKRFEEAIKKLSGKNNPATEVEWLSDQINRDPSWWNNVKSAFDETGYAEGGAVEYNPSKVDDILNQIKRDMAVEASLPDMGHPDSMRLLDYARRLSVTGGGGRDDYGVGFGGRLGYNQPVGRGVTVRPYVEGHYYKPAMGGPAQKGLSGVGVNLNVPFAEGGLVEYDPNKVDELVRQLREEMYG